MKSLLVYTTQLKGTGGIESHVYQFLSNMKLSYPDVQIDLLCLKVDVSEATMALIEQHTNERCLMKAGEKKDYLKLAAFAIRKRFHRYDALYTNGQGDSIALVGKMFRFKKWVHHHHTSGDVTDQGYWSPKYWQALKTVPNLIACSERNAEDMTLALKRSVDSIPCFSNEVSVVEAERPMTSKISFGYYGRLIKEKGIDVICQLSTVKELADISFHLWGEGVTYPPDYFDQYPNVNYHGKFSGREELLKVVSFIDGYLLFSTHSEGLPISLLELTSAGKPWLATDKGGIRDIVCDEFSTRVIPDVSDFDLIRAEVRKFADDLRNGSIDSSRQKKLYQEKFSADVLVKKWQTKLLN